MQTPNLQEAKKLAQIITTEIAAELGRLHMTLIEKEAILQMKDQTITSLTGRVRELEESLMRLEAAVTQKTTL